VDQAERGETGGEVSRNASQPRKRAVDGVAGTEVDEETRARLGRVRAAYVASSGTSAYTTTHRAVTRMRTTEFIITVILRASRNRDPGGHRRVESSYSAVHTGFMTTVRRTISLPPTVAARLDREAKRRETSFSALIVELVSRQPEALPYAGVIDDDEDLSDRVEEVLSRLAG
jgi:predicted CopG family antitoxin